MACSALLAAGVVSCSKDPGQHDGPGGGDGPTGTVTVRFGFDTGSSPSTYAYTAKKPVTTWTKSIDDMLFIVADATGEILDSRELTVPIENNNSAQAIQTLTNIIAGTDLQVWVIANLKTAVKKTSDLEWVGLKGRNVSEIVMQAHGATIGSEQNDADFGEMPFRPAPEIFAAVKIGRTIGADTNTDLGTFKMNRVVSLFRVLIDKETNNTLNADVDFTHEKASLRIRRTPSTITFPAVVSTQSTDYATSGDGVPTYTYTPAVMDPTMTSGQIVTYVDGRNASAPVEGDTGFKDQEPNSADYTGSGTMINGNFKTWRDVIVFPGGEVDGAEEASKKKYDVVIMGWAPGGYRAQSGVTVPAGGGLVAWSGNVNSKIEANQILEVAMTLSSAGVYIDPSDPVIPEPGSYGHVDITVQPMEWGNIVSTDMEL